MRGYFDYVHDLAETAYEKYAETGNIAYLKECNSIYQEGISLLPFFEATHPRPNPVTVLLVVVGIYTIPVTTALLLGVADVILTTLGVVKVASEYGDDFVDWLDDGAANNAVYHGVLQTGELVYTGITRQTIAQRLYQHLASGKPFARLETIVDGLTRNQARAIEQYFIEQGMNLYNKINSISPSSQFYEDAMKWAAVFISNNLK